MQELLIPLKFNETSHIALWKLWSEQHAKTKHVLLTHGTFSNRKVLNGIAEYLVKNGYTCWVYEWRDHGSSSRIKEPFNFETIAKEDLILVFDYLFVEQQLQKVDCVTHSGGGICLTIALIHRPEYQQKINTISMFGCQAFGASTSIKNRILIFVGKYLSKILGFTPGRLAGSEENEKYPLIKQWYDWNLEGRFIGADGFDYQNQMKNIQIPILSIFGGGDTFIAPPEGCQQFLAAFKNADTKALLCSKENGFLEDYNHSRLLHSRNASKEIYPFVLNWMNN